MDPNLDPTAQTTSTGEMPPGDPGEQMPQEQGQDQFLPEDFDIPLEGAMARNPVSGSPSGMDETQVGEEEQAMYDEFTSMALKIVHSLKKAGPNRASADIILDYFKADGATVPQALGVATAEVCYTVHNFFKHNKVEISADVVFASAQEVLVEIYDMAITAKVVPVAKLPPDGSIEEEKLLGYAFDFATEHFMRKLQDTGQLPTEEAKQHLNEEMEREAMSGELDDWDPRAEADANGLSFAMKKMQERGNQDPVAEMEKAGYKRMVPTSEMQAAGG